MATALTVVCDCCNKPIGDEDPRYSWKMRQVNIREGFDRLPFADVCAKCNTKVMELVGGSRDTWSQNELQAMSREQLRELADPWGIQGREKTDLVVSLTGKAIGGPPEDDEVQSAEDAPEEDKPKGKGKGKKK